jgi:hypothetical protein
MNYIINLFFSRFLTEALEEPDVENIRGVFAPRRMFTCQINFNKEEYTYSY